MKRPLLFATMMMLSSLLFAQPSNDLCSGNINLIVDNPCVPGTTIGAGTEEPVIDPSNYPTDVWYSFTATSIQSVVYVYPDLALDPDIYIFDNCGGLQIGYASAGILPGETDSLSFATSVGVTYFISIVGWMDNPNGSFCIEVLNTAPVDLPYNPCTDFTNISVTDPCLTDNVNQDTLLKGYTFTAISLNTKLMLQFEEPAFIPVFAVMETDCNGALIINWGDGVLNGNTLTVEFPTVIGNVYFFAVMHTDPTISYQFPLQYCIDIDVTLGNKELETELVKLYPNPAKNEFRLTTKNATGQVEVIDMTGRIVHAEKINSLTTLMNIQDLISGIYMVRYTDGIKSISLKLIKE